MSPETLKEFAEIDKADGWLLALNLREMDRIDNLTPEEISKLLSEPMSRDDVERLRQADQEVKWLLDLNLREMDRGKTETDDEKED